MSTPAFSAGIETRFFRIIEGTKNEYVSIGADGRICRWGKLDGEEEKRQQWCIYPVSDGSVMIQTLQNEEFMSVTAGGPVRRWAKSSNPAEQSFHLVNFDNDGWFNIEEMTRGEYLGVGEPVFGVCFLVRWQKTGGKEQQFKLEAVEGFKPEPMATLQPQGPSLPPQKIESFDKYQVRTERQLISQEVVSSLCVNDPYYTSKISQVRSRPYYYLSRYQLWDSSSGYGFYKVFDGRERKVAVEVTVKRGFSRTDTREARQMIGWSVEAEVATKLTGKATMKDPETGAQGEVIKELSASLKANYKNETELSEKNEEKFETERTVTYKLSYEARGKRFMVVQWGLVDEYELTDHPDPGQAKFKRTWRYLDPDHEHRLGYPELPPETERT
jgi:Insecticidal Crystal Toxin, P42